MGHQDLAAYELVLRPAHGHLESKVTMQIIHHIHVVIECNTTKLAQYTQSEYVCSVPYLIEWSPEHILRPFGRHHLDGGVPIGSISIEQLLPISPHH